jgi:2-methylcitrate dehydratase PrpD
MSDSSTRSEVRSGKAPPRFWDNICPWPGCVPFTVAEASRGRLLANFQGKERKMMTLNKNQMVATTASNSATFSRRSLLQGAGCAIAAAAALPGGVARAGSQGAAFPSEPRAADAGPIGPVMTELSNYMAAAPGRELPEAVVEEAKNHILDTFAAMVSGAELPPGRVAIQFARSYGGEKIATVVASNVVCGPIEAALANAVLAHSDETDDSHSPSESHPGSSIVPATLAMGEKLGIDGTAFLRAVTLGYDVGPRIGVALGGEEYRARSHRDTHSIVGTFGSAAAAACVAGLNAQQMRWAMDYASQQASGIAAWQRDPDHIEKGFVFAGGAARDGVTTALLLQAGWTGVDDVLSGADNFFLAFEPGAITNKVIDKLGERYEVTQTNIKKWTVGSPIQAPLDALENIQKKHPFTADQVQKVVVRVARTEAAIVDNRDAPDICMQYMLAVMLLDKTASFQAAHDKARMRDPAVARERAKVQLVKDDELQKRLPRREAFVELTLTDGTQLTEHVTAVRGTSDNPMTKQEVIAKARDLMAPVLGASTTGALIEKLYALEKMKDIRELRPLLQKG